MNSTLLSPPELQKRAVDVLIRELGVANAIRFCRQLGAGRGNYVEERKALFAGWTADTIRDKIMEMRERNRQQKEGISNDQQLP